MAERTPGGCAAIALSASELGALALIFLAWSADTYFSWDPQHIGGPVGPYILKMAVVAAIAAAVTTVAALRHAPRTLIRSQAAMTALTLAAMAGLHALGATAEEQQRIEACHSGLAAPWCEDLRQGAYRVVI
ncbi:hypothetical protein [Streptomyces sp. NPDC056244]|uniref:hypothetical protein n=1 Tax=Streptomyces sp. NPDC056244 TaxID=3345762 RepID=UPI0035E26665